MSDPIDFKKAKKTFEIVENNTQVKNLNKNTINLNSEEVYEVLSKHSNEMFNGWTKLQQAWCHNAYNTFKDYDTYLIQCYLVQQIYKKHSDLFQYLSFNEFYSQEELMIDRINLIEISKELNIAKETVRRKVNYLQSKNIIYRKGKSIYFNNGNLNNSQRPIKSKRLLSVFLEKSGQILSKEKWFGKNFSVEEIENFVDTYFTVCWQNWFRLQLPYLVRHRTIFGDLETWNVWGAIGISQFTDFSKKLKDNIEEDARDYEDLYIRLLKHTPKNGINASSISEISTIPRATVIRKLKILTKQKFVKKNNKLEYMLLPSPKNLKHFELGYKINQKQVAIFVTQMFDLMKNSKLKIPQ